jgi:ABC-2 type transport system permease protein
VNTDARTHGRTDAPTHRLRLGRFLAVARKEILQLRRDPRSLAMAFVLPAFLTLVFGWVMNFDVRDLKLGVLDQDRSQKSRELVNAFTASGYFTVTSALTRPGETEPLLERGTVRMVLVIPPGFQEDLNAGRRAPVQALVDGADANTASIALNYAAGITTAWGARAVLRGREVRAPLTAESRVWYNEELKSSNMVVPGLIAVIMMIIASMLTALTIAREWERGTMEQLAATPVHPTEVILGKLLPYFGIGLFDTLVAVIIAVVVFHVPLRGSVLFLFANTSLFLLGALGLGIFISAAIKNQLLATQVAMVATYLPALLLSGLMFDIASMPTTLRTITYVMPARYFVTVLRGIFLKGVGLDVLWPQSLGMALFAAVGLTLATLSFRKEIG